MSKLRQHVPEKQCDLSSPAEGDLRGYVIFTQLKVDGPYIFAGWLDAPDAQMALDLAVGHYGRDQACTDIWAAPRDFIGGLKENAGRADEPVSEPRAYQIFTQREAGDQHVSSVVITARSAVEAISQAEEDIEAAEQLSNIWAIPRDLIASTDTASLVWDNIDQDYRLARGYSKTVRQKWEQLRAERDLTEYEKDDLKDTF